MTLDDGLFTGQGVAPNATNDTPAGVYAFGPNDLDEKVADAATAIHAGLVLIEANGGVAEAGAGATSIVGIARERHVNGGNEDFFAAYAVGEEVPYYHRIGLGCYVKVAASQTIPEGAMLQTAAGGLVQLLTPAAAADIGKHKFTAKAAVTTAAGETAWILAERVA